MTNNLLPQIKQEQGTLKLENKQALKEAIQNLVAPYKQTVVSESTQKEAKKSRAELNKMMKALDDKRKEIKVEYLKPLDEFENDMKEVISIVNEGQLDIKNKLDEIEAKRIAEKAEEIKAYIEENATGYEIVWNNQWMNKTYKMEHITDDIQSQITELKMAKERMERDKQSIQTICDGHSISAVPYIAMFESGTELSEVVQVINHHVEEANKEVEQVAPVVKDEEDTEAMEQAYQDYAMFIDDEDDDLITQTITVTGTIEQLKAMDEYCQKIGVKIEIA